MSDLEVGFTQQEMEESGEMQFIRDHVARTTGQEAPAPAEADTVDAEAAEEIDTVSVRTLDELKAAMKMLQGLPGWSVKEITAQASKTWARKIESLDQLAEDEAAQILSVANGTLAKQKQQVAK